jgi:CHRD domain
VTGIRPATMAHIHRGAVGVAGPIVVTLRAPTDGMSTGCVRVAKALAAEIATHRSGST